MKFRIVECRNKYAIEYQTRRWFKDRWSNAGGYIERLYNVHNDSDWHNIGAYYDKLKDAKEVLKKAIQYEQSRIAALEEKIVMEIDSDDPGDQFMVNI